MMNEAEADPIRADRPIFYRRGTSDEAVLHQVFIAKDYDLGQLRRGAALTAYWQAKAADGMRPLIVDAGANIGAASLDFLRTFPNARIVAIEPDRQNYQIMAMNAEGYPIACLHAAVTARPGLVRVVDPGEGHWGFRTERLGDGADDGTAVAGVQIGAIYAAQPADTYPFIVKIDIEGGEEDLFSGDLDWLERTPLVIIELHDWLFPNESRSRNFLRAVSRLDRDFVHIGENVFSIDNRLGK